MKRKIIKKPAASVCMAAVPALCILAALAVLPGCSSGPPVIPEDLSVMQFFQRAQEESDSSDWDNALFYYETFIERHPEDSPNIMAARYEIAYIHYKQGEDRRAANEFQEILSFYETTPLPLSFPLWPRVLAKKLLETLAERGVTPEAAPPAAGPNEAE